MRGCYQGGRPVKFPIHTNELTGEWLTNTLRVGGALTQARVTALDTHLLDHTKGTTGQIARLRLGYDRDEPEAPRSLIAKFSASDPQARALIHGMGFYEREVRFYEQLSGQSRLRTPRCYFSALDETEGLALLLLEDLDSSRNGASIAGCSLAEAELAVRAIAPFHATWWQHPQLETKRWLELRSLVSVEQTPAIFQQTWGPFLAKLGTHASDEILQVGAWLGMYLDQLCAYLYQAAPRTLIHNDYQADNLFFAGAGASLTLTVADWQLTTRGRAVLDIAAFLGGNLDPRDRYAIEPGLLRDYHTLLVNNGVRDYNFEQCWDDYRIAMLFPATRIITIVGIGAAPSEQERGYCDVLLPRFCRAVHELKAGEALNTAFSSGAR
jgi:hypothetical protein